MTTLAMVVLTIALLAAGVALGAAVPRLWTAWLVFRAQRLMSVGDHREAILPLSRALALRPKMVSAYILRSQAFLHLEVIERALADADEAVRLAPKNRYGRRARARLYAYCGQDEAAIRDLQLAVRHNPKWLAGFFDLASQYLAVGKPQRCLDVLARLINHTAPTDPIHYDALVLAGCVHEEHLHDVQAAIGLYTRAVSLAPERRVGYMRRAWAFRVEGAYYQAAEDLLRAGPRFVSPEDLRLHNRLESVCDPSKPPPAWMAALQRFLFEADKPLDPGVSMAAYPTEPHIYLN